MEEFAMLKVEETIIKHYSQNDLSEKIISTLENAGKNINSLTTEDIATFDEFHFGGRTETRSLA